MIRTIEMKKDEDCIADYYLLFSEKYGSTLVEDQITS